MSYVRRYINLEPHLNSKLDARLQELHDTFNGVMTLAVQEYVSDIGKAARRCAVCNRRIVYGQPHFVVQDEAGSRVDSVRCLNARLTLEAEEPIKLNWFNIWSATPGQLGLHTYSINRRKALVIANYIDTRRLKLGGPTCTVCGEQVGGAEDTFSGVELVGRDEHHNAYHLDCTIPDLEPEQADFLTWAIRVANENHKPLPHIEVVRV